MNVLELAKQRAVVDPDKQRAVEERRSRMDRDVAELYAHLEPLAGAPVRWNGTEGRLHVSLLGSRVNLAITEREMHQGKDGSIRKRETRRQIALAWVRPTEAGYAFREWAGAERAVSQTPDLIALVAEILAPMLVLEEM